MLRRIVLILLAVAALGLGRPAASQDVEVRYDNHALVRVEIASELDIAALRSIGARLAGEAVGIGPVEYVLSPEGLAALQASGLEFRVLVDNLQPLIDAERQRLAAGGVAGGWFNDFKDYDAVNAKLAELAALRPDLASTFVVGNSLQGRPINGIRITGPGADKPAVLLNGCQHAREWIAVMVPMYIADRLLSEYDVDPVVQDLVDAVEFLIIPIVNPDGYVYSWGPDRLWRKNRRDNGNGTIGVDLNRNWDYGWGLNSGSSPFGGDETYRGPFAFSEPETQAMRDFYLANPQLVTNIDFHSHGQLILYPWGYTGDLAPDVVLLDALGDDMASSILAVHGRTYTNQQGIDLYPASGISIDWTYGDQAVFSYTFELRSGGGSGFELPPGEIIPNCEEIFPAVLDLAEFTTQGVLFEFPVGLPAVVEADATTPVQVQITPVTAALAPGTARLLARVGASGAFTETSLNDLGGSLFEGLLPAVPCGDVVQFYFEVETDDAVVHRSPGDAPAAVHEAESFQIGVGFADDFESDLGWAVANDGLTDGAWERGVPISNAVCDRGNPGSDADGSGQCYLTDNSSASNCNSDVDGGTTTLTSPAMDASDPAAAIAYWRWYNNSAGSNPQSDTFAVEVSDDDGASWVALETVGPAGPEVSGGWFRKEFPITEIAGIANSSLFRIRFHATDLGGGSVVEAAVDGVEIRSLFCDGAEPCPWDFDGDGGVGITDFLFLLGNWGTPNADTDGDGDTGITDFLGVLGNWGPCP